MRAVDRGVLNIRFEMIISDIKRNYSGVVSARTQCEPVIMSDVVWEFYFIFSLFIFANHACCGPVSSHIHKVHVHARRIRILTRSYDEG